MPSFLGMFTDDAEVVSLGLRYSNIAFAFSLVIALGLAYEKIFQSVGRMASTMFCMMCGCVANIILDPIMIFGFGPVPAMGIEGAAWATGIGQTLTLAMYLLLDRLNLCRCASRLSTCAFRAARRGGSIPSACLRR